MKTVYRILAPILSIAILPILYFLPMLRAMVSSDLLGALSGKTDGPKTNLLTTTLGIGEFTSIHDVVKMAKSGSSKFQTLKTLFENLGDDLKERLAKELSSGRFLIAALVFFALLVLLVLAFTVVSAVMKKQLVPLCLAGGALVSALAMNACFNAFAKPFLTGAVSLATLLGEGTKNAMLTALLGNAVTVNYLQLSLAYTVTLFVLAVILIFTVCALVEEKVAKD